MDLINNSKYKIILGSSSSRRKQLLEMQKDEQETHTLSVKKYKKRYKKRYKN